MVTTTPAEFFHETLPRLAEEARPRLDGLPKGTIAFDVEGAGQWSLKLSADDAALTPGIAGDAAVKLKFKAGAFDQYRRGWLDVVDAVLAGELEIEGDLLFERMFVRAVLCH